MSSPHTPQARILLPAALPVLAAAAMTAAIALMFFYAPTEALQGPVQRIFYVHVPAAWVAYLAFAVVALSSLLVLVTREPATTQRWDRIAGAGAELGVLFTTIVLITGPIWGRRVWGVWWVWDARLTSTLVLWTIYAGYLVFRSLTPPGPRRARTSAVIGIIGAIDIPVVHFAVVWWRTLHPLPTVLRPEGPQLPRSMLVTLLVSLAAFTLLFWTLLVMRVSQAESSARLAALGDYPPGSQPPYAAPPAPASALPVETQGA
ncbi:MAG TPA: cytochrome c biogenesis protein CcsA [Actinomycetota bacterium]|nr:cytochrome c biogenesis protein CcsA [Actinomycetota bacterium]